MCGSSGLNSPAWANLIWCRKHISGPWTKQLDRKLVSNLVDGKDKPVGWNSNKYRDREEVPSWEDMIGSFLMREKNIYKNYPRDAQAYAWCFNEDQWNKGSIMLSGGQPGALHYNIVYILFNPRHYSMSSYELLLALVKLRKRKLLAKGYPNISLIAWVNICKLLHQYSWPSDLEGEMQWISSSLRGSWASMFSVNVGHQNGFPSSLITFVTIIDRISRHSEGKECLPFRKLRIAY